MQRPPHGRPFFCVGIQTPPLKGLSMIKLFLGFLVFAGLALFILSRGGDIDMSGEKHGIESHDHPASAAAPAPAAPSAASAPVAASQ